MTPPTVVELTIAPCSDGIAAVERAMDESETTGETSKQLARRLVDDAERLCRAHDGMAAEQKLALAWTILIDVEE